MNSLWQIFRLPLLLAALSLAGLLSALLADGPGDALSWLCLGGVVWIALRHSLKQPRQPRQPRQPGNTNENSS